MGPIELLKSLGRLVEIREALSPEQLPEAIDTLADGLTALAIAPRAEAVEIAAQLMARGFEGAAEGCSTTETPQKVAQ